MRKFVRLFIVFICLFSALFVLPNNAYACEDFISNTSQPYIISSARNNPTLINNKQDEYYVVSKNNNRLEITNSSNRTAHLSYGCFSKTNAKFDIINNFITRNATFATHISYNISQNLENAIYTRAP